VTFRIFAGKPKLDNGVFIFSINARGRYESTVEVFRNYVDKTGLKLKFPPHNFEKQVTIDMHIIVSVEKGETERETEGERARADLVQNILCLHARRRPGARNQLFHIDILSSYRFIGRTCLSGRGSRSPFSLRRNEKRAFYKYCYIEARHIGTGLIPAYPHCPRM